jgi:perosamine synthetase
MSQNMSAEIPSETRIAITRPVLDEQESAAVDAVLNSGWVVQGPRVAEFERMVSEYTGARHAVATTSCTTALHLALLAAGIGPGDEVILPAFTFIATANAIEYVGARPVFVDISLDTFTISPDAVRKYINRNRIGRKSSVKAIVPVSLFGLCANMAAIHEIARDSGLVVIEDAACGMGAKRQEFHAGREALAGVFSFHPRKVITTGEGGMLITDNDELAALARKLRDHGASATDLQRHLTEGGSLLPEYDHLGYNYRMTDIQGSIGVVQMGKLEKILAGRKRAAARYDYLLQNDRCLRMPYIPDGYTHAYQSYVCLYKASRFWRESAVDWDQIDIWNKERNRLMKSLEEGGISVRQGTHAVHALGYYKKKYGFGDHDFPMSFIADRLSLTLPLYSDMTDADQIRVVTAVKRETAA